MSRLETPSSVTAFNILPIELNKAIAHYLDDDRDIAAFSSTCHTTRSAIYADLLSFWRTKFREKYDFVDGPSNILLLRMYQRRSKQFRRGIQYDFFRGHGPREARVARMLKDLIIESFQGATEVNEHGHLICKNQVQLIKFVLESRLLNNDRRAPLPTQGEPANVEATLAAVKLMCSQFIFNLTGLKHNIFAFDESQYAVYQSSVVAPIFTSDHKVLNLEWILHSMNFFRHHMMNEETQTLFDKVDELEATHKPSAWREPLRQGAQPLSKHWKGTYSFLEHREVNRLRRQGPGKDMYCDKNIDEGKIQSLKLNFAQDGRLADGTKLKWPTVYEQRLGSLRNDPGKQCIRTQGRNTPKAIESIQFKGRGEDLEDDYKALGWLNPLPPQGGIPGWQRITFMKHFSEDYEDPDHDNLWAYEGAVLPGGRIILGRWWFASNTHQPYEYNGPFILWAVDEPELDEEDADSE
ncbi:hypothetical protein TW65_01490 [Stemphylium lycopersici]|nr:hypothetical protein TW65_01490 [Stemphylium lycopersici]